MGQSDYTDVEELRARVEAVYDEIALTVACLDDVVLQQMPQVEADYQVKIGCYERELLQAQIDARRAKRKLQLAQADANRGLPLRAQSYEEQLDYELEEWNALLSKASAAFDAALDRRANSQVMSADASARMKKCYRKLAKRLHPDLHPDLTEHDAHYFTLAQKAYEQGDIELLESIEVATRSLEGKHSFENMSYAELEAELIAAEAQLSALQTKLETITEVHPYCLREQLADADWIRKTVEDLRAQIEAQNNACATYVAAYEKLASEGNCHEQR